MTDDTYFPKPEGGAGGGAMPSPPVPETAETPTAAPVVADGFGAQNSFNVSSPAGGGAQTNSSVENVTLQNGGFFAVPGDASPLQVPGDPGFQFADFNMVAQQVQFVHFVMPFSKRVTRLAVMISQIPTTGTLDLGVFNKAGTSKLVSSGPSGFPGSSPNPAILTVSAFTLVGGTEYILALLLGAFTGATPGVVGVAYGSGTIIKWNQQSGSTLPGYKSGTITYAPALSGTLPNDLTAGTPTVTAGAASGPLGVLGSV